MKIDVILPCFLGEYNGSATERETKLNRAIQSFLRQDYSEKRLIVVSDGCQKTMDFMNTHYSHVENIKYFLIPKQPLFSGQVREHGLRQSDADLIAYLDSDDMLKNNNHISLIVNGFKNNPDCDWLYFDDYVKYFHLEHLPLQERNVDLQHGMIGTSNIAHRNHKQITWNGKDGYGHDYHFISSLMSLYPNKIKIGGCSYVVCHIPKSCDS
jgi:glycosyltransferase involved in cell wall biosynthesis